MLNRSCELDLLFPPKDDLSAHLRMVNALALLQAGSIDAAEGAAVLRKASEAVYRLSPVFRALH